MSKPILATKLYRPPPRPHLVVRPRLIERLNEGLHRKLTLIAAPAGFGKTTLVSEWLAGCELPAAWLSLDEEDADQSRFLTYLVAALRTLTPQVGAGVLGMLASPQPPSTEAIVTTLLNEITTSMDAFILFPLDSERRWYRYHHLFADLLRQRLHERGASPGDDGWDVPEAHRRASIWYEDEGTGDRRLCPCRCRQRRRTCRAPD